MCSTDLPRYGHSSHGPRQGSSTSTFLEPVWLDVEASGFTFGWASEGGSTLTLKLHCYTPNEPEGSISGLAFRVGPELGCMV